MKKPEINYPCEWTYLVIGTDARAIRDSVSRALGERDHTLEFSNFSSGGKYLSFKVKTVVADEKNRKEIYTLLWNQIDIKQVI